MELVLVDDQPVLPAPTINLPDNTPSPDWVRGIKNEFDSYYLAMKLLRGQDSDQVFGQLAAWVARAYEMRGRLMRASSQVSRRLVDQEVDPFIQACRLEFQIYSRLLTNRQHDWEMSKGYA